MAYVSAINTLNTLGLAIRKPPSLTVTRSWGNHDLQADLGNNTTLYPTIKG